MSTNARTVTAKERPILFSRPMVQALRAGRKTQTRRVVKFPPNVNASELSRWHQGKYAGYGVKDGFVPLNRNGGIATLAFHDHHITCPYGVPGDRLWVKETWWRTFSSERSVAAYCADVAMPPANAWKKVSSIHMPRWASRLTLEVVSVRVERVQDISEADARAEGVGSTSGGSLALPLFEALWKKINGPDSWGTNPWVWVVEFRRFNP